MSAEAEKATEIHLRPMADKERAAMRDAAAYTFTVPISGLVNHVAQTAPTPALAAWVRTYGAVVDGALVMLSALENQTSKEGPPDTKLISDLIDSLLEQVVKLRAIGKHLGDCGLAPAQKREAPKIITEPTTH